MIVFKRSRYFYFLPQLFLRWWGITSYREVLLCRSVCFKPVWRVIVNFFTTLRQSNEVKILLFLTADFLEIWKYFYFLLQIFWNFEILLNAIFFRSGNTSTSYRRFFGDLEILLLLTADYLETWKYFYFFFIVDFFETWRYFLTKFFFRSENTSDSYCRFFWRYFYFLVQSFWRLGNTSTSYRRFLDKQQKFYFLLCNFF